MSIVERHIRTIKERVRSFESGLPYKLARRMVVGLIYFVVSRSNLFPASEQKDDTSPKENYLGVKPDYYSDVKDLAFGDYVQAHEDYDEFTNLPRERTRGCIALYPKGNSQGA